MYGIISKREYNFLEEMFDAPSFHIREGDLYNALLEASRVQLDFLIIDADFSNNLEEQLHQYRVKRPFARIIIIAPGREPGDYLLAKIAGMGIYDIVNEEGEGFEQELLNCIKMPATYSQGARWIQNNSTYSAAAKKGSAADSIREVLIQQRPLGLTTIAIAGVGSGAGASHLSLAIATNLARSNNKVVLAEWAQGNEKEIKSQYIYLSSMGAEVKSRRIANLEVQSIYFNNFDIFLDARSFRSIDYIFPFINQYDYLVLDLGEITPEKLAEMDRAALSFLVVNTSPYRIEKFLSVVDGDDINLYIPNLSRWKIALNLSKDKEIKWFTNYFSKYLGKTYPIPYMDNLHEQEELFNEILKPVLPVNIPQKKKPFWKFK